jgi:glycosyltransferase involved in cell wall biosynthesis
VSFLALCYNHAPHLVECLHSIEAQQWPGAELVILDNASTDGSPDLIRRWAAGSSLAPRLLLQSEPRGICANVNEMLRHVRGEYVALIATDDYWFPHKTARQVAVLERLGPQVAVAYADAVRIDPSGHPLDQASFIQGHREMDSLPAGDILHELLRGPFIPAMSTLVRRSALEAIGGYDESLVYEDYDAWLRLAEHWHFHADPEPLSAYRVLPTSMIRTVAAQDRPEKILSDARIMAKAAVMARLPEKTRVNLRRRLAGLGLQLLAMPGPRHPELLELHDRTGLRIFQLLAAVHRHVGPMAAARGERLLAAAVHHGWLPAAEWAALPKTLTAQWPAPGPATAGGPAPATRPLPATEDQTAWVEWCRLLEAGPVAAPPDPGKGGGWWRRGRA